MINFLHFSTSFYHLVVLFELCEHHVLVLVLVLDYQLVLEQKQSVVLSRCSR